MDFNDEHLTGRRLRISDQQIWRIFQRFVSPISADSKDRDEVSLPASHDHRLRPPLRRHRLFPRHKVHRRNVGQGKEILFESV